MPENQVTHAEWHRHVARVTQAVIELQQAREADLEARREAMERDSNDA